MTRSKKTKNKHKITDNKPGLEIDIDSKIRPKIIAKGIPGAKPAKIEVEVLDPKAKEIPDDIKERIAKAIENGDLTVTGNMMNQPALNQEQIKEFVMEDGKQLFIKNIETLTKKIIDEITKMDLNDHARFATVMGVANNLLITMVETNPELVPQILISVDILKSTIVTQSLNQKEDKESNIDVS